MPWIVYNDTSREIVGIFEKQAKGASFAAGGAGRTAHPTETVRTDWDANAKPGWYFTAAGAVVPEKSRTAVQGLQLSLGVAQGAAIGWYQQLAAQQVGHDPEDFKKGGAYLWRALQFLYIYCRTHEVTIRNVATPISLDRRTKVAQLFPYGALDIVDVPTFYEKAHSINESPIVPAIWVHEEPTAGADPARVNLNVAQKIDEIGGFADVTAFTEDADKVRTYTDSRYPTAAVDLLGGWPGLITQ